MLLQKSMEEYWTEVLRGTNSYTKVLQKLTQYGFKTAHDSYEKLLSSANTAFSFAVSRETLQTELINGSKYMADLCDDIIVPVLDADSNNTDSQRALLAIDITGTLQTICSHLLNLYYNKQKHSYEMSLFAQELYWDAKKSMQKAQKLFGEVQIFQSDFCFLFCIFIVFVFVFCFCISIV